MIVRLVERVILPSFSCLESELAVERIVVVGSDNLVKIVRGGKRAGKGWGTVDDSDGRVGVGFGQVVSCARAENPAAYDEVVEGWSGHGD